MNPSKEALDAAKSYISTILFTSKKEEKRDTKKLAAIIDRHFETLRRDNATLAGRLTAAELERDSLGARAEQAEAEIERWRVAAAKLRDGAEEAGRVANEQIARAEERVKELEAETKRLLRALTDIATAKGLGFPDYESECEYMRQAADAAIDMARQEVKP